MVLFGFDSEEKALEKIFERNLLFDFYGEFLTEHQRTIYESAVKEDMSLSELSEMYGITRQGVHDLLKRCDKILSDYEAKLNLIDRFNRIKNIVLDINVLADEKLSGIYD